MKGFRTPLRTAAGVVLLLVAGGCQAPAEREVRNRPWAGTAQVRETDFDRRLWHGTSADTVRGLMERLPDRIDSAAEHRLARNLLISIADAPQGDDDGGATLSLRVDALMRYGAYADAVALSHVGRTPPYSEASAEREAEAELLVGNIEMACIDLRALAARSSAEWVGAGVALCKTRAGDAGVKPHPESAGLGALARIRGVALAIAPPAGEPPGTEVAYLAAVAADPKSPAAQRLEAAFAAARANAIGGPAFAKLLRSAPARGQPPAAAPVTGEQAAVLFQAVEHASDPAHRLALAERGLLSSHGAVDGVGTALAEALRGGKPGAALAGRYAAYFYATGDGKAAAPLAERAKPDTAVWPYRALQKPPEAGALAAWDKQAGLNPAQLERVQAILAAFAVGPAPADSGAGELRELDAAATGLRSGETTLRALVLLGQGGPAAASTLVLYRVLRALDRVALHEEARALAFEALAATLAGKSGPVS